MAVIYAQSSFGDFYLAHLPIRYLSENFPKMKTAKELASSTLDSPDAHKRRALAVRRLAGGVRTEIERKGQTGLSDKEVRVLQEAVLVFEKLSTEFQKAQALAQVRRDGKIAAEREVKSAMLANFGKLASIADRVALVAAVRSYSLRKGDVKSMQDLCYAFDEAIDSLSYQLAEAAITRRAADVVAEAWLKFDAKRLELADTHAMVIGQLAVAGGNRNIN